MSASPFMYVYLILTVGAVVLAVHAIIRRLETQLEASAVMLLLSLIGFLNNLYYGARQF